MKPWLTDPLFLLSIALLGIWVVVALVLEGPGWIHGLLTLGVFLMIYRIVAQGAPRDGGKKR